MTSEYFVILCLVWGPGGLGYKDSYLKPSNPILNNNADLEIYIIIANHIQNWLLCHLLTGWPLLVGVYEFMFMEVTLSGSAHCRVLQ